MPTAETHRPGNSLEVKDSDTAESNDRRLHQRNQIELEKVFRRKKREPLEVYARSGTHIKAPLGRGYPGADGFASDRPDNGGIARLAVSAKNSPGNTLSGLRFEHSSRRFAPRTLAPGVAGSSFWAGFSGGNLGLIADESAAGKQ